MNKEYVVQLEGAYRIAGTRVSLDSIIYAYHRGASPESIQRSFPTLSLEQIYGAITFYLAHQDEVDKYLSEGEAELEKLLEAQRAALPEFYERIERARKKSLTTPQ
ncbi:MAG: hypothetical protein AUG51_16815 [Acidobacteria bacterium 13_1_20CM_3_53_8]|nr:MAG: hypothetical protein AUG51_16815 [Acidobacteria bacterium 13_1_20CM_3_53_8]